MLESSKSDFQHWFEVPQLMKSAFLAINLSNRKASSKAHNDKLLPDRITGDWPLPRLVLEAGIEGKTIVLFYTAPGGSTLFLGSCKSKEVVSETGNGQPRYQLTASKPWKPIGKTEVTYSKFFSDFRMNSNPTVIWASDSTFVRERRGDGATKGSDPDDDGRARTGGTNVMALVAQRASHNVFVDRVKSVWGSRCALTRLKAPRLVEACHLVPWCDATPQERTSAHNGLMLCAHLHALLDSHLLGFDDAGNLLLAADLDPSLRKLILASEHTSLSKPPSPAQVGFLRRHRDAAKLKRKKLVKVTS